MTKTKQKTQNKTRKQSFGHEHGHVQRHCDLWENPDSGSPPSPCSAFLVEAVGTFPNLGWAWSPWDQPQGWWGSFPMEGGQPNFGHKLPPPPLAWLGHRTSSCQCITQGRSEGRVSPNTKQWQCWPSELFFPSLGNESPNSKMGVCVHRTALTSEPWEWQIHPLYVHTSSFTPLLSKTRTTNQANQWSNLAATLLSN